MKKETIIISFTMLACISLFGQDFVSPNKQWNVRLSSVGGFSTEVFKIDGDSTIDTLSYSKIWVSYDSLATWCFQGLLREKSNIVYYLPPDLDEGILYDFNLEVGDSAFVHNIFCGNEPIPIQIIKIDTVDYFGMTRKRWQLDDSGTGDEYWVEGIGSMNGPLYTKYSYCIVCPGWELLCYHYEGLLQYIMPGEADCYVGVGIDEHGAGKISVNPNPVKRGELVKIELDFQIKSINVYSSSGKLVKEISSIHENNFKLETGAFSSGVYLIRIETEENQIFPTKIVIE